MLDLEHEAEAILPALQAEARLALENDHAEAIILGCAGLDELCASLRDLAAVGDLVICMGAGDITKWAAALADGVRAARAAKG